LAGDTIAKREVESILGTSIPLLELVRSKMELEFGEVVPIPTLFCAIDFLHKEKNITPDNKSVSLSFMLYLIE